MRVSRPGCGSVFRSEGVNLRGGGRDATPARAADLPTRLCAMNLLLHGIETPESNWARPLPYARVRSMVSCHWVLTIPRTRHLGCRATLSSSQRPARLAEVLARCGHRRRVERFSPRCAPRCSPDAGIGGQQGASESAGAWTVADWSRASVSSPRRVRSMTASTTADASATNSVVVIDVQRRGRRASAPHQARCRPRPWLVSAGGRASTGQTGV